MNHPTVSPGFRLSMLDSVVLVVGASATAGLAFVVTWAAFVVAFVVVHFFLFCNVFRISRSLELAWGALFILLSATTLLTDQPGWLMTAVFSLVATAFVVILEMRKPSYHGVGWQCLNPGLPDWWESNLGKSVP